MYLTNECENVELSVIIINWNTAKLLIQTIQSIYDTAFKINKEIIVVDNASSDNSVELLLNKFPEVRIIVNRENLGFSMAANIGLKIATGRFILITHADIELMPTAIEKMISFLSINSKVGIVGANLLYPDGSYNICSIKGRSIRRLLIDFLFSFRDILKYFNTISDKLNKLRESYHWSHIRTQKSEVIWNACMMFKRDILLNIEKFSEEFFVWFADVDFCYRAAKKGWECYYLADAKVIHYETQSLDYLETGAVKYKIDSYYVMDKMSRDMSTLIRKHHSYLFYMINKILSAITILARHFKRFIKSVFFTLKIKKLYK